MKTQKNLIGSQRQEVCWTLRDFRGDWDQAHQSLGIVRGALSLIFVYALFYLYSSIFLIYWACVSAQKVYSRLALYILG